MSLKRRTKLQHYPNSHNNSLANSHSKSQSQIFKQIHNDISISHFKKQTKQQTTITIQNQFISKMQAKIRKIINAYQKLEAESKRKDDVIKQLQKQNQLLKQRIVAKNQQKQVLLKYKKKDQDMTISMEPIETHVIQRTFTPVDSKKFQYKKSGRPFKFDNPASSMVQQYNFQNNQNYGTNMNKITNTNLLKESKSVQNLYKPLSYLQNNQTQSKLLNFQTNRIQTYEPPSKQFNPKQSNIFSRRDQNRITFQQSDQDKTFLDVLGKLKDKIKKYDQQDAQNFNTHPQVGQKQSNPFVLSKVKSSHNLSRKNINLNDTELKQPKKQIKVLKQIWNQRDEEIKRMDELFKNIDQRLNISQK